MSERLLTVPFNALGVLGLNTNTNEVLPHSWAAEATNFVFGDESALKLRSGWQTIHTTALVNEDVEAICDFVDATETAATIAATTSKLYRIRSGGTVEDITGTLTPTSGNWKFFVFNEKLYGVQAGHDPIVLDGNGVSDVFTAVSGTTYQFTDAIAYSGRIWAVLDDTLYYSDMLSADFATGSAGSFDLRKYWPQDGEHAVGMIAHNGRLFVFGPDTVLVYDDPSDPDTVSPSTMQLVDTIVNAGCVGRDTIVPVGTDVIYASQSGLLSLGRIVQEKSAPMGEISRNIQNTLAVDVASETSPLKACYHQGLNAYLLSLPGRGKVYFAELSPMAQSGIARYTSWELACTALHYTSRINTMWLAPQTGTVGEYRGIKDGVAFDGTGGQNITSIYESPWTDLGDEYSSYLKIPKTLTVYIRGIASTLTVGLALDYDDRFWQRSKLSTTGTITQYGSAQYAVSKYSGAFGHFQWRVHPRGTGRVVKLKIEMEANSQQLHLQRAHLSFKLGRLS